MVVTNESLDLVCEKIELGFAETSGRIVEVFNTNSNTEICRKFMLRLAERFKMARISHADNYIGVTFSLNAPQNISDITFLISRRGATYYVSNYEPPELGSHIREANQMLKDIVGKNYPIACTNQ